MTQGAAIHEASAPSQETDASAVPQCRHHWIIESPQGATSRGVCKLCRAERDFPNSAQDYLWDGESFPSPGPGRWSGGEPSDSFREERAISPTVPLTTWTGGRTDEDDIF